MRFSASTEQKTVSDQPKESYVASDEMGGSEDGGCGRGGVLWRFCGRSSGDHERGRGDYCVADECGNGLQYVRDDRPGHAGRGRGGVWDSEGCQPAEVSGLCSLSRAGEFLRGFFIGGLVVEL